MRRCLVCGKEIKNNEFLIPKGSQCCICGDWICNECLETNAFNYEIQNLNYSDLINTVTVCDKCDEKYHKKFEKMEKVTLSIQNKMSELQKLYEIMRNTDD